MPLCAYCGKRILRRHNDWHEFGNALERATLLALHRDKTPFVKKRHLWDYASSTATPLDDKGWVLTLKSRGLWNVFCGTACAWAWLKAHLPPETWEPWPPPTR